jgi:hypothetical protein
MQGLLYILCYLKINIFYFFKINFFIQKDKKKLLMNHNKFLKKLNTNNTIINNIYPKINK